MTVTGSRSTPATRTRTAILAAVVLALGGLSALTRAGDPPDPEPEVPPLAPVVEPAFKPKFRTRKIGNGSSGAIAIDAEGGVHVAFRGDGKNGYALMYALRDGDSDGKPERVTDVEVYRDISLAVDDQGDVHVVYGVKEPVFGWTLRYARLRDGEWEFEDPDIGAPYSNSLVVDDEGVVHVSYASEGVAWYARRLTDGTWLQEFVGGVLDFTGTSLALQDGQPWVAFCDVQGLALGTKSDALPFFLVERVDDTEEQRCPSLAFDADGTPHIVYANLTAMLHAWSVDDTWKRETLVGDGTVLGRSVPEGTLGDAPKIALDPFGRLVLVAGYADGPPKNRLVTATYDGTAWSPRFFGATRWGYDNGLAIDGNGIPHMVTRYSRGSTNSVKELPLKPAKLRLVVKPDEAGTIAVMPIDVACDGKCNEPIPVGVELTVTATPAEGYAFQYWSGTVQGFDPTIEVTTGGRTKLVAHFVEE